MTRPALLIAAALLVLSACTGGPAKQAAQAPAVQQATVRTARCGDWNSAPVGARWQLVRGMRTFFGGQVDSPGMRGQVLPDRNAYQLFAHYCSQPFARSFTLYRLYGNAAAFTAPRR